METPPPLEILQLRTISSFPQVFCLIQSLPIDKKAWQVDTSLSQHKINTGMPSGEDV